MHIPYSDNKNIALFGEQNKTVPLVYFNIINLKKGESYSYKLPEHETSVVPATGIVELEVDGIKLVKLVLENLTFGMENPKGATYLQMQNVRSHVFRTVRSVLLLEVFMRKN